ncbi:MAG: DNA recombination protein RmuC [Sulfurimonas sp.]|nr:DNA recombination protein RmuC [Sulfurimonadaceae bacterium]
MEFHDVIITVLYVVVGVIVGGLFVWIVFLNPLKLKFVELGFEKKSLEDKIELLEENKESLKLEFKELSSAILESNSQKFATQNKESLDRLIEPIKLSFDEFKKQVNDVYINEAKDKSALINEIKNIKEINQTLSTEASNLTKALKGESKTQGIWGEMILESVLQNSGLRAGVEYERELSLKSAKDEQTYRPDVVLHLPHERDIIIDAKTSLSAYERVVNATNSEDRELYMKEHIDSIKNHIKQLSKKSYVSLDGLNSLDFVFMFVPLESALVSAMEYESGLFDEAYKKGVLLVGPTTLMVSLKSIESNWRYENQHKNALEIAKRAGLLYDKFVGFLESVEKMGRSINTLQKSYDETFSKMHIGAGSITSQFLKLEQLGAAATKKLPPNIQNQVQGD